MLVWVAVQERPIRPAVVMSSKTWND